MNTPIFNRALLDHFLINAFQPPPEFVPPPPPTRHDAELVVAGIEGKAIVHAGANFTCRGVRL